MFIKIYGVYIHNLGEKFCGEGVPDWVSIYPDYGPLESWFGFPFPLSWSYKKDSNGIPSKQDCEKFDWTRYFISYAFQSSVQKFYDNVDGIQDSFVAFWKYLATEFKDFDNVLGEEVMNEPFAGNVFKNPLCIIN